ncbi:macrophage mannose receptor 1-like isoform X2 [Xyrauchen texanus]|uniref:macrophage mannose receptor 1-like isoform X2 n=1 Tax=Xyrauchen texanus TaxID=154827 RepID=UPI0022421F53|nr:macrophage mannose receptor 1-like isoform X2 [Xyrauchen texanus]
MDQRLAILVLLSGILWSSSGLSRQYHYINERMPWSDAQSYCRSRYTDLATVDDMNDVSRLVKTVDAGYSGSVWIGLKSGTQSRWGWSKGDNTLTQYSGWKPGKPDGEGKCVYFAYGFWINSPCSTRLFVVCYNESTGYNMVNVWKNWTEAQSYCRQYHTDLATIRSSEEQNQLNSIVGQGPWVWIGLFLDSWEWSDQWSLFFRYWATGQPSQGSDCVGMLTNDSGRWVPDSCDLQRPFVCHGDERLTKKQIVRLKLSSDEKSNLNDPLTQTAVLNKISEKLKSTGLESNSKISWRKQEGENMFQKETKRKGNSNKNCDDTNL